MPAAWSATGRICATVATKHCATCPARGGDRWTIWTPPCSDLFADEPRIGVLEASRRLGVARGTVQARLDKLGAAGVIAGWGPELEPGGARLPGHRVLHPGDPPGPAGPRPGRRAPGRASPRCSRRTRSPAPATCGPGSWPAPTPTCSGSSTRCSSDAGIVRSSTVIALATQIPYRVLPLMDASRRTASRPAGSLARVTLVAGVDCSTQNTKVVVCDADTGEVVREGRAPHPDVTEVDARVWWQAWEQASAGPARRRRGGRRRRPAARHGARRRGRHAGPRRPAVERQPLRPAGRRP